VVRAVNSNMVVAYWLIGREIVETIQEGEETAEYGRGVLQRLSDQLTESFGSGYSARNLRHFRQFYRAFADRLEIRNPAGSISLPPRPVEIWNPAGSKTGHDRVTGESTSVETSQLASLFAPELTWSHYRAL